LRKPQYPISFKGTEQLFAHILHFTPSFALGGNGGKLNSSLHFVCASLINLSARSSLFIQRAHTLSTAEISSEILPHSLHLTFVGA
jgi:hypothetical protein